MINWIDDMDRVNHKTGSPSWRSCPKDSRGLYGGPYGGQKKHGDWGGRSGPPLQREGLLRSGLAGCQVYGMDVAMKAQFLLLPLAGEAGPKGLKGCQPDHQRLERQRPEVSLLGGEEEHKMGEIRLMNFVALLPSPEGRG